MARNPVATVLFTFTHAWHCCRFAVLIVSDQASLLFGASSREGLTHNQWFEQKYPVVMVVRLFEHNL